MVSSSETPITVQARTVGNLTIRVSVDLIICVVFRHPARPGRTEAAARSIAAGGGVSTGPAAVRPAPRSAIYWADWPCGRLFLHRRPMKPGQFPTRHLCSRDCPRHRGDCGRGDDRHRTAPKTSPDKLVQTAVEGVIAQDQGRSRDPQRRSGKNYRRRTARSSCLTRISAAPRRLAVGNAWKQATPEQQKHSRSSSRPCWYAATPVSLSAIA